jgi:hypothetical protein
VLNKSAWHCLPSGNHCVYVLYVPGVFIHHASMRIIHHADQPVTNTTSVPFYWSTVLLSSYSKKI